VKEPVEEREAAISEAEVELELELRMCCCVCIVSSQLYANPSLVGEDRGRRERGDVVKMWSGVEW
jgi:hypothetical protein